uniref:Glucuronosyltransferase n=1 Tax=Colobus angolensis palliatus TaxID=336983 RepID=A0A2K5HCC1_COLAP
WAAEYSHWMNMKTILEELVHRGHEVTVLASSASILFDPNNSSALKFEVFPTSLTKTEFNNISMQEIKRWSELPKDTFWLYFSQMQEMMWMFGDIIRNFCKDMVSNKKLMKKLEETMGKADIWLIRNSWNFQFPHPLLPNVDFVGGLHCKPAKPLPKEMEEFVQSSGENGVVVFSLGSMVINMKEERANVIASALAQIPQKVLWRFDGKKPDTLGLNTRLYKWIPQNDLLGKTLVNKYWIYYSSDLLTSLDLVPIYKENVMKLSRIQHDQPVKPLDRAVFWIEFVMRHKGAKHLRVAAHDLTWFQYHSLDVIGFLLACVGTVIFVIMKCCLFCFSKLARKGKKGKSD